MKKSTIIYGLYSTRDNDIRYVGKSNNPKSRLKDHIWSSKSKKSNTYKSCWIRKELNEGYNIKIKVLEVCDVDEWPIKEQKWVKKYNNLTNHHKGGLGGSPLKYDKTYDELKSWVNENLPPDITSGLKWRKYVKENFKGEIPINPNKVYKNCGWDCWAEFLNTDNYREIEYVSFNEFKKWVKENVNSYLEFKDVNKPIGIPCHPERVYKGEWPGWGYIIRGSRVCNRSLYWSYIESKKYLNNEFGDLTITQFRELCKNNLLPIEIPKKPERVYKNFNFKEFLRVNYIEVPFLTYEQAKKIIHKFKLTTNQDWRKFKKSDNFPDRIPRTPEGVYKDEWVSWGDWLGTN